MKNQKQKLGKYSGLFPHFVVKLLLIILAVVVIFGAIGVSQIPAVRAEDNDDKYTAVSQDIDFGTITGDQLPKLKNGGSSALFHIGEGVDRELFVYILVGDQVLFHSDLPNEISMGLSDSETTTWKKYPLRLVNAEVLPERLNVNAQICKFVVEDFTVLDEPVRYYNIASISRPWVERIDGSAKDENGTTQLEKAFPVGQLWRVDTTSDSVKYSMKYTQVINITDFYPGQLIYSETGAGVVDYEVTNVFYLAFTADKPIDTLLEADVDYIVNFYVSGTGDSRLISSGIKTVTADGTGSANQGWAWWSKKHTWKDIESVGDFVRTENLSDEAKKAVENKQWVIRFYTHKETYENAGHKPTPGYYYIDKATILRLKYVYNGNTFNLGVVANTVQGGENSDNTDISGDDDNSLISWGNPFEPIINGESSKEWKWYTWAVLFLIGLVVLPLIPLAVICIVKFIKWLIDMFAGR